MSAWITLGDYGVLRRSRIIAVGSNQSTPLRRMVTALPLSKVIILTGGKKRQSIILLDTGHAIISHLTVAEVNAELQRIRLPEFARG